MSVRLPPIVIDRLISGSAAAAAVAAAVRRPAVLTAAPAEQLLGLPIAAAPGTVVIDAPGRASAECSAHEDSNS